MQQITKTLLVLLVIAPGLRAEPPEADRLRIVPLQGKLRVESGGQLFTEFLYQGYKKPVCYPVIGPAGVRMTRDYPMKKRPGEAPDHPHHRSLWFTHGNVNGVDFWDEGQHSGRQETTRISYEVIKNEARIRAQTRWVTKEGKVVCRDERMMTFSETPAGRAIDFDITVHASEGPVVFGDTKEGSMGIRTHSTMRLSPDKKHGVKAAGHAVNSEGHKDRELWGKRARWVDYWAPIDGNVVGVAIFDHPENHAHPTYWHARAYGLVAANPFGLHHFLGKGDQPHLGDLKIAGGGKARFRYRFLFHRGDAQANRTEELWKAWAASTASKAKNSASKAKK